MRLAFGDKVKSRTVPHFFTTRKYGASRLSGFFSTIFTGRSTKIAKMLILFLGKVEHYQQNIKTPSTQANGDNQHLTRIYRYEKNKYIVIGYRLLYVHFLFCTFAHFRLKKEQIYIKLLQRSHISHHSFSHVHTRIVCFWCSDVH